MCIVLGVFELSNQYFVLFSKMCVPTSHTMFMAIPTSVEVVSPIFILGEPK